MYVPAQLQPQGISDKADKVQEPKSILVGCLSCDHVVSPLYDRRIRAAREHRKTSLALSENLPNHFINEHVVLLASLGVHVRL